MFLAASEVNVITVILSGETFISSIRYFNLKPRVYVFPVPGPASKRDGPTIS